MTVARGFFANTQNDTRVVYNKFINVAFQYISIYSVYTLSTNWAAALFCAAAFLFIVAPHKKMCHSVSISFRNFLDEYPHL